LRPQSKNAKQCPLVLEPAPQVSQESKVPLNSSMMAQNQTTTSAGAKEGSAVISVPEDVSGLLMSGDHSNFNVLENQHNLSLGHPQGDYLNPPAGMPMSSHSGEPGVVLQSLAFQPLVDTDCLNETAFPIDEMLLGSGTFFDPSCPSWGAVDFSAGSN
jgi:hypothetical protein